MKKEIIIFTAVFMIFSIFSCYEKKLTSVTHYSMGTWNDAHTEFIFLRWERDYHRPKGITKFPDGGVPKYVRDEKRICVYSKETGQVKVIAQGRGKPRGLPPSVRFSWKGDMAAYKIWNVDPEENALNPVVVINMKTGKEWEFTGIGERPELSPDGSRVATVRDNSVWIMDADGSNGEIVFESGEPELIFLMWSRPGEMELYIKDFGKFAGCTLDLEKRELKKKGKPYVKFFGNESTQRVLKSE
ncbi:MAG TPA: hypothetical protein PK358_08950 [Spirochaetota bacterium]|nr:hypothetical protein [Spirochaetota bacterium]HPJ34947.1 hypothetical protein [Spirochaetota bacterium]